ncbi:MAG TPA: cyclopropane-fatty-acyl-phospholipid synthase family protein [Hyphomicrobiaceae bacterium]|nr:cyclopropane-fatty-acyl-phospholipid synthase family protein [Hyphomicrobiaceae bacterium]
METLLQGPIKAGRLKVTAPDGRTHVLNGTTEGPVASIRIADKKLLRRMLVMPDLYLGEAYTEGLLTVDEGSLYDVLDFFASNLMYRLHDSAAAALPSWFQNNVVGQSKANVAHHYDLNRKLFELFLDRDLQYSCAYFTSEHQSLEDAQANKKRRIAAKLLLKPGMRVLDIGSGFGGLALGLAQGHDVEVVGLTLSEEQWRVSQDRARAVGLDKRVAFKLLDYREETGRYDRIVSVGMFEHVGRSHYDEFFGKMRELMTDDGVCLLHSIGRMAPPGSTSPWLIKYIFPGGYVPSLSETMAAIERTGLWITDVEILRLHYAETLRHWHRRFQANRDKVRSLYDERFCRMWEFYLQLCEIGYRRLNWMVFQAQIAKRLSTVPLTRTYLARWDDTKAIPCPPV